MVLYLQLWYTAMSDEFEPKPDPESEIEASDYKGSNPGGQSSVEGEAVGVVGGTEEELINS